MQTQKGQDAVLFRQFSADAPKKKGFENYYPKDKKDVKESKEGDGAKGAIPFMLPKRSSCLAAPSQ